MTERAGEHTAQWRRDAYRRALDLAIGAALTVVVLPIILVTALGSAMALRSWPFFVQERVGRAGVPFRFIKVRTLPVDMPTYIDKHQLDLEKVPAFCRILRRLHLDELPQLLLVLRGHMSLVGPRPEMAHLHAQLPSGFAELRTSTRPGCTGLWQIGESCSDLIGAAPEYDRFYIENRSLRLDLWVLARTAVNMVGFERPVQLEQVPAWALPASERVTTIDLRDSVPAAAAEDALAGAVPMHAARRVRV